MIGTRHGSKALQAVKVAQRYCVALQGGNECCNIAHQFGKEACFEFKNAVLRAQYLVFILLQLLRDVAFSLCKRLLSNPRLRHLVLIRIAHLDVVAKHVVKANLEAWNARSVTLALLYLHQIILA